MDFWRYEREKAETIEEGLKILKSVKTINGKEMFTLMLWKPRGIKPEFNYWYQTEERRQESINRAILQQKQHNNLILSRRKERKAIPEKAFDIKKGQIFYTDRKSVV